MRRLGIGIVSVAALALIGGMLWQHGRLQRAKAQIADLEEQVATDIPTLQEQNQSLWEQLQETAERLDSNMSELLRLRGQSVKMRHLEEEVESVKAERDRLAAMNKQQATGTLAEPGQSQEPSVMDQNFGAGSQDVMNQALCWATTLRDYADTHDGQYPSSLSDAFSAASGFSEDQQARMISGINRFELVYHGTWSDLTNLAYEGIIVVRERQPWVGADGKWHKAYGMAPGNSQLRTADNPEFFSSYEAVRIIR